MFGLHSVEHVIKLDLKVKETSLTILPEKEEVKPNISTILNPVLLVSFQFHLKANHGHLLAPLTFLVKHYHPYIPFWNGIIVPKILGPLFTQTSVNLNLNHQI